MRLFVGKHLINAFLICTIQLELYNFHSNRQSSNREAYIIAMQTRFFFKHRSELLYFLYIFICFSFLHYHSQNIIISNVFVKYYLYKIYYWNIHLTQESLKMIRKIILMITSFILLLLLLFFFFFVHLLLYWVQSRFSMSCRM